MKSDRVASTEFSASSSDAQRASLSLHRRTAVSIPLRGGGPGSGSPSSASICSTSYTSEPSRRNTPCIPVCDAMPASCAFMPSNSGPSVSVRRYRMCRR